MNSGFLYARLRKRKLDPHEIPPQGRRMMGLLLYRINERRRLDHDIEVSDRRIEAIKKKLQEMGAPVDFI
jgi:hypothetical protein